MPIYEYQCLDCGGMDLRVGGLDDHTALCAKCGGLMLRLNEDIFQPYFDQKEELPEIILTSEEVDLSPKRRKRGGT